MIPAVLTHCAGIDIGKRGLAVCLMVGAAEAEPKAEVREFSTFTADIEAMKEWLVRAGCTHVVMESTGSYWKPVFNVLEGSLAVCLANSEDVKGHKGHKTDRRDARWLAHLLRHDMIRASFVPPRAIRSSWAAYCRTYSASLANACWKPCWRDVAARRSLPKWRDRRRARRFHRSLNRSREIASASITG
jgi:transposase